MDLKKHKWLWLAGAAAYPAALALLTLAERDAPDASIRTFADAFWYSLVTMSTVGYGDLYPVTNTGRLLGTLFILLSLGLLTCLIGFLIQVVTGRMLPSLKLWLARKKRWYIFSCQNSAAFALAQDLIGRDPDRVLLFPACADSAPPAQLPCLIYSGAPEALAARKKDRCCILFMDEADTYARAVAALETGHQVCCRTTFKPDACPEGLTLFDPFDSCAQRYWSDHGLRKDERALIIIGDGRYAESLLTRGLLLNVSSPERTIAYHIFGDRGNYLRDHHRLSDVLCLDGDSPEKDRLCFHQAPWNEDAALLASAQRIILCHENEAENIAILGALHSYFPVRGKIHLLCRSPLPGETVFGTEDSIYTEPLVLQEQLSQAARAMHSLYQAQSGGTAPSWEQLSEFHRQSNIAAAAHLLTKIRILLEDDTLSSVTADTCRAAYERYRSCGPEQKEICRQIEHLRWMRFHSLYNWRYAPVRNNAAREHPLMVPYEQLSPAEQAKDDHAWVLLDQLANQLNT